MTSDLLTYQQVAAHYGLTITGMYNRVYRGTAPTPVRSPSGKVIGWRPETIEAYDREHTQTGYDYHTTTRKRH